MSKNEKKKGYVDRSSAWNIQPVIMLSSGIPIGLSRISRGRVYRRAIAEDVPYASRIRRAHLKKDDKILNMSFPNEFSRTISISELLSVG